jgi:hypothetical protein
LAKGNTAIDGLSGSGRTGGSAHSIDPHWPGNVFDLLLAQIIENKGQPVAHVVINRVGDEHSF